MNAEHTTAGARAASRAPRIRALLCSLLLACGIPAPAAALQPAGLMRGFDQGHLVLVTASRCIFLDIFLARSREQRAQGLMYVERMELHEGMLFVYPGADIIRMWMKNTLIPLDMVFALSDGRVAQIHENARPHDTSIISSGEPVSLVLELNAGAAARFGIRPGDRVTLLPG